jgi:hypothetical protein
MAQTIGKIKVVVNNQSLGPVNVRQSNQTQNKVQSISYGQLLELHRASDLSIVNPEAGDAILYDANTNNFIVGPIEAQTANIANTVLEVFGGTF